MHFTLTLSQLCENYISNLIKISQYKASYHKAIREQCLNCQHCRSILSQALLLHTNYHLLQFQVYNIAICLRNLGKALREGFLLSNRLKIFTSVSQWWGSVLKLVCYQFLKQTNETLFCANKHTEKCEQERVQRN